MTTVERESHRIGRWLRDNPYANDTERARCIGRLFDLERTTPLSRQSARADLNASAYYHVQPCRCDRCRS